MKKFILISLFAVSVMAAYCSFCDGTGQKVCTQCQGVGMTGSCYSCSGTGIVEDKCAYCSGSGSGYYGKCMSCNGDGYNRHRCSSCNGTGYANRCFSCGGRGVVRCISCSGSGHTRF